MRKAILCLSAIPLALSALSGCGGGNKTTTSNEVPVVMTVHDAPATGVTMLSFSAVIRCVTITNSSGTAVSLLSSPVTVNLQNLATQSDILADTSAPAGTYSSMMVTLSSVNMTIQNNSGSTVSIGA